jgi:glucose/arabinose dehydrogenase
MITITRTFWLALPILAAGCGQSSAAEHDDMRSWQDDWDLENGFSIEQDATGFHLPTAIAFVPEPGLNPEDPLYFVAELRGTIRVVTNDRSVHMFAEDFFDLEVRREVPSMAGQIGLAGICVHPGTGFVFATFAYQDPDGILRNNVVRFSTSPEHFATQPTAVAAFTDVFRDHPSGLAHQIGGCEIVDDQLYVSVGDAWRTDLVQDLQSLAGKVLRMSLDGEPYRNNPFFDAADPTGPANYVWAKGFRNPFGLKVANGRMFVAENGVRLDRFLEVKEGDNYLWDGTDASIATNASYVFSPAAAPVHLTYADPATVEFPQIYDQTFFVALSGNASDDVAPGVMLLPFDFELARMRTVPAYFLRYRGPGDQMVSGVAFGPDGLYVAPILPDRDGQSAIYRISYVGSSAGEEAMPMFSDAGLLHKYGCRACHTITGRAAYGGQTGPSLQGRELLARLRAEIENPTFEQSMAQVDAFSEEPWVSYADARSAVRQAEGMEQIRLLLKYRIMEPRFDRPQSAMPSLGVSEAEAEELVTILLGSSAEHPRLVSAGLAALSRGLPERANRRHQLLIALGSIVLGFFAGVLSVTIALRLRR